MLMGRAEGDGIVAQKGEGGSAGHIYCIPSPFLLFLFLSRGVFGTRAGSKYGEGGKKKEMERRPFSDRHLPEGKYGQARRTTDTSRLFGECKKKFAKKGTGKRLWILVGLTFAEFLKRRP